MKQIFAAFLIRLGKLANEQERSSRSVIPEQTSDFVPLGGGGKLRG
jgi:hypothetical protein